MADEKVEFELVAPERLLVSEAVEMVVIPGTEGDFGVLPRHSPLISTVRPGVIRIYENGNVTQRIFVAGGFAEVTPERCTVLAEEAVEVSEIDRAAVERRLQDAREDLADATTDEERETFARQVVIAETMLAVQEG